MKRSAKLQKVQVPEDDECGGGNYEGTVKLYGKWQLEPLNLPHAVNGIVPKVIFIYFLIPWSWFISLILRQLFLIYIQSSIPIVPD